MSKHSCIHTPGCEASAGDVWLDFLGRAPSNGEPASGWPRAQPPELAGELLLDFLGGLPRIDEPGFRRTSCARRPELRKSRGRDPQVAGARLRPDSGLAPEISLEERLRGLAVPLPRGERFVTECVIARGGMGVIRSVRDVQLNRRLVLKEIDLGTVRVHSQAAARFLQEAQITAQLDHPGIVPVYELGLNGTGNIYFAMKLVQGSDLRTILGRVREGGDEWTQTRVLGVLLRVCEVMAYAHSKGVIHRDLKPGNVMVGDFGEVYVLDWGLARVLGREDLHDIRPELGHGSDSVHTKRRTEREETPDSPLVTMDGAAVGTPAYMPPEQARGEIHLASPSSDVYAIGAMLYHLLTGQVPFVPANARLPKQAVLALVIDGPPRPVHQLNPEVATDLIAICEKAMARAPRERYPDTLALGLDLRAYLEGRVVGAREAGILELNE